VVQAATPQAQQCQRYTAHDPDQHGQTETSQTLARPGDSHTIRPHPACCELRSVYVNTAGHNHSTVKVSNSLYRQWLGTAAQPEAASAWPEAASTRRNRCFPQRSRSTKNWHLLCCLKAGSHRRHDALHLQTRRAIRQQIAWCPPAPRTASVSVSTERTMEQLPASTPHQGCVASFAPTSVRCRLAVAAAREHQRARASGIS
jgi:hypothetical protein